MVPSDFTYMISVIGVIHVIGVIQFCKGPPFHLLALLLSLRAYVIDVISLIGVIELAMCLT